MDSHVVRVGKPIVLACSGTDKLGLYSRQNRVGWLPVIEN